MKIVFIAGPYRGSGEPGAIERNLVQSARYQAVLARAGIVAYSPNLHDAHWESLNHDDGKVARKLKEFTERVLEQWASALAVMPGWETSVGTLAEIRFAEQKGIPIFYLKGVDDLGGLQEWYDKQ